jgi:hypothetical protein
MAVSYRDTTHGLLNAWQRRMRVSDWHFNQVTGAGVDAPVSTPGNQVWVQPEREGVAEGIFAARGLAVPLLGFHHRPVWVKDRLDIAPGLPLRGQLFETKYRYIHAIGKRGTTVIQASAAVVFTDDDGDTVAETATVTVPAGTITDPGEVEVFFTPADSLAAAADIRWQIDPVAVSISGGNIVITGHRSLFTHPALWRTPSNAPNYNAASKVDGDTGDPADFVTEVDVYRVFADPTDAVTVYCQSGCCGQPMVYTPYEGNGLIVSPAHGILRVDATALCPCAVGGGHQRYIEVWMKAGYPLDPFTGLPNPELELAFLRLANAEIPYAVPTADARANIWFGDTQVYEQGSLPPNLLNNPLGVKVGQVEAWRTFKRFIEELQSVGPLGGVR